jgi:two-component system, OmpR family, sensor histidine kinase BaeS
MNGSHNPVQARIMTLSIRTKLFLTLLTAGSLVVAGMFLFMHWSFHHGLEQFARARQDARIEEITERLAALYRHDGGWERLRRDKRLWVAALAGRDEQSGLGGHGDDGMLPFHRGWMRHAMREPGLWPPERVLRAHPPGAPPRPVELRLMLLDADGSILYGRPALLTNVIARHPIEVDGRQVGSLALLPGPPISERGEILFLQRQTSAFLVIALVMAGLSAAFAFPLAQRLVRPVQDFQGTAQRLAAGDYTTRVAVTGGDELGRLGRDLNILAATLERNEHARRRWVADISHELRTPLAVMRAELEALQDGVRPLDLAAVDALHSDTLRLGRLVDDLYELSMSDLGALTYRKAPIDPTEVLAADVETYRARFAAADIALTFDNQLAGPVLIQADEHRLSQLFRNLLRNSLQYTDAAGALKVTARREATALIVDFRDTAPAVPPEALPRLFERLYRVDASRSRNTGGAGLGLAIAKNIADAHGALLNARAAPEGGLWIQLRLPL